MKTPIRPSLAHVCDTLAKNGKIIQRSAYQPLIDRNKQNIIARPELYKQRQALVKHPFGTMNRQWGFDHIMTKKTKAMASADVGFISIIFNNIDKAQLAAYLKACLALYIGTKAKIRQKWADIQKTRQFNQFVFQKCSIQKLTIFNPDF